jgi:hypothetical protein
VHINIEQFYNTLHIQHFALGSNWQVYSEGLQFEDSYNAGTTYQDGDVVTYGGYSYVYSKHNTNSR